MITSDIILHVILIPSLQRLYETDYLNLRFEASERNICARLAHHMENIMRDYDRIHESHVFDGYFADVEYNRMGYGQLKHIMTRSHERRYIVSDLLIQQRGFGGNLLAAELKRKGNKKGVDEDKSRLKSLVSLGAGRMEDNCVYDTRLGAFIVFSPDGALVEIYEAVNGRGEKTGVFRFFLDEEGRWQVEFGS